MLISVIIPTYNKLSRLKLTLCALKQQNYTNYQLVIVDDGSDHQTKDYLHELQCTNKDSQLKILHQNNQGRSKARNVGAQNADGNRLVFIDDDIIIDPNFLGEHAKYQDVVLHGKIMTLTYLKFFKDPTKGEFYKEFTNEVFNTKNNVLRDKCISHQDIRNAFYDKIVVNGKLSRVEWLIQTIFSNHIKQLYWLGATGGNFSIDKKCFDEVGGFDEVYGQIWGYEDFDLGYRLLRHGYRFAYSHHAVGYHIAHYRNYVDVKNENSAQFICKYPEDFYLEHVINYLSGSTGKVEIQKLMQSLEGGEQLEQG